MKKLSIEQKMQYLQKCLEMGADINVYFHNFNEEEALQAAETLSQLTSIPFESQSNKDGSTNWFKIKTDDDCRFEISIFYNKEGYMFEDIHWDGMEEDEHVS